MEYAMYPSKYIRITQKDHEGTHIACWAVDEAGKDTGAGNIIAPVTAIVKKIYAYSNEVWLQSKSKVKYADGTEDYMTILFCHDNSVTSLYVGKEIKQGEVFYQEGTKGNANGNHLHFECGKGKFSGTGWYQDSSGAWSIINGKKVTECLWIDDTYQVIDTKGYKFRNVKEAEMKKLGTPVARDEYKDQVKIKDGMTTVRARNKANGDILGYMNIGLYNILEIANTAGYTWYRVENNLWFAYSPDWAIIYPKEEKPAEPTPTPVEPSPTIEELCEKLQQELVEKEEKIEELEKQINSLETTIINQEEETKKLIEELANQPTLIFTSPSTDYYAIYLKEGQKLFLQ